MVESDPDILGGKPVVRGTRIPVDLVLELINLGYSSKRIADEYPELSRDVIIQLAKLAKIAHESVRYEKLKSLVEA